MILSSKEIREWREVIDESLLKRSEEAIDNILSKYPKARRVWDQLRNDSFTSAQWDMSDYIAVTKMGYNAHGDIHAKIVTANALKMLDLLLEAVYNQTSLRHHRKLRSQGTLSRVGMWMTPTS